MYNSNNPSTIKLFLFLSLSQKKKEKRAQYPFLSSCYSWYTRTPIHSHTRILTQTPTTRSCRRSTQDTHAPQATIQQEGSIEIFIYAFPHSKCAADPSTTQRRERGCARPRKKQPFMRQWFFIQETHWCTMSPLCLPH